MRNKKAERTDNIPAEILKSLGEKATKDVVQLCQDHLKIGETARGHFTNYLDFLKEIGECVKTQRVLYHQLVDICFEGLTESTDNKATSQAGTRRMIWGRSGRVQKGKMNKRCHRSPKNDG